jgi:hypothetical protein
LANKKNKRKSNAREPLEYEIPFEPEEVAEEPRIKYKTTLVYILDQDEVNGLIEASTSQYVEPQTAITPTNYPTYTAEECTGLMDGYYYPRKTKKKK